MERKPQISFIIVNYNSKDYLEKCLASVFNNTQNISKEIIVVNSCDDILTHSEDIKIITALENKGFGYACNVGAKAAQGETLCFLNPDTEIVSDYFEKIISEFEKDSAIGIIGPKLVDENNNNIQEWCAGKEVNLSDILLNNIGLKRSKKIWESNESVECAWVSGACLFIKKELFEKLKGFDENFFLYFEDIDLCQRARNLGYKIIYNPKFTVKHFGGKSFEDKKKQKKLYYESQDYYFEKHFGKIATNLLKLIRSTVITR